MKSSPSPRVKRREPTPPAPAAFAKSARKPRPRQPVVSHKTSGDPLFEALRGELGL